LREHILRTLFFTDMALFIGTGILIAASTIAIYRYIFHITEFGLIASSIFILELFFSLIATLKMEKQPIYKLIPRALNFSVSQKQFAKQQVRKTTGDFKILGNYIIRKKKLIAVYEILPFDIALLNEEERERFYGHIKTMLHTLPENVQLILRKERAEVESYNKHFYSLFETANPKLDWMINRYIEELSGFITLNNFQIMKYYAVFSTSLISENDKHITLASQKLQDMVTRFSASLAFEKIQTIQLTKEELINYFKKQFRNL
jgi:hypothetical protein